ncbi:Aste57867_21047 [Aphanomyces stellatus]|uniref:Aste57867_21047 protein n=1 Tax=Aphanomyces stellatus TaxID=120398 RepID=A0A485LGL4_9STRA|nr:hypothetical protein As57867_020979 [Aphanomyces stellatus]VFT97722.1 Aste57867_21047 [Aphanomyces stellatus]
MLRALVLSSAVALTFRIAAHQLAPKEQVWAGEAWGAPPPATPRAVASTHAASLTVGGRSALPNTTVAGHAVPNNTTATAASKVGSPSMHTPGVPYHTRIFLSGEPRVSVVESLPVGDFSLAPLPNSTSTAAALIALMDSAVYQLDICAMYWNLLGLADHAIFSPEQMTKFGADRGVAVFAALERAIHRGVVVRVIGSSAPSFAPAELAPLALTLRLWDSDYWYGGGIMHQKLVLVDERHAYVGSANMDWKSLAQVMEVGVLVESSPVVVQDMQRLFELWWVWADPTSPAQLPVPVDTFVERFQAVLRLPPWSPLVSAAQATPTPFNATALASVFNKDNQMTAMWNGERSLVFVTAAPDAATARARTFDEDGLIYTIESAKKSICLSVMDFVPFSTFPIDSHPTGSIYWPALTDALLAVVFARPVTIKLLISHWAHTSVVMVEALKHLEAAAETCPQVGLKCRGSLQVRLMEVPGWDAAPPTWPPYSRVNHAKYIVTDQRANVGTSNMEWGYFYNTAGTSLNTDNTDVMDALQKIFDRNWDSSYAHPLRAYYF